MAEPDSRRELYAVERERIRRGGLRGEELLGWIAGFAPPARERAVEELLGIDEYPTAPAALGPDLLGYTPAGVAPIVRAVFEAPVTRQDVFVDLGAGLGKVALLVHLLSGARVRGIELQPDLVARANARARRLGLTDASFIACDVRDAALDEGNVFFLYLPFTGTVLAEVLQRLHSIATRRDVVVCSLGLDLPRADWLTPRATDAFWLSIYDGRGGARPARAPRGPTPLSGDAEAIALERARFL